MHPIKIEATVDEGMAQAIPALRPLLGKRVELIALESGTAEVELVSEGAEGMSEPAPNPPRKKLTFEELFARRIVAPPGTPPLTEADIETAIIQGALDGNV